MSTDHARLAAEMQRRAANGGFVILRGPPITKFFNTKTGAIIFTPDPDGYYGRHQDWEARPFDARGRP